MGSDPDLYVTTKVSVNMPAQLTYPEAQPDLRNKLGKDLRKKLE